MALPAYPAPTEVDPPAILLQWDVVALTFDRSAGRVSARVRASAKAQAPLTFSVDVSGGTLAPGQFYRDPNPFTVPTGSSFADFYFELVESAIAAPGTIIFSLSSTTPGVTVADSPLVVSVTANVVPPGVRWQAAELSLVAGGTANTQILATGTGARASVIVVRRVGGTLDSTTASWPGEVLLPTGAVQAPFQVSGSQEGTLVLQIESCTPGHVLSPDTLTVTVEAAAPLPTLRFAEQSLGVNEGSSVTARVELSAPLGANLPIGVQLLASSSASASDVRLDGDTFPAPPAFLQRTLPAGATHLDLEVQAVADAEPDNYETANLLLVYSPSLVTSTPALRRTAVLIDDGTAPPLDPAIQAVQFETISTNLIAGDTNVPVRLRRNQPPTDETVLVTLEVSSASTATLGQEIGVSSLQVQIPDRATTVDILVSALNTSAERDLVLRVAEVRRLSSPPALGPIGANVEHTLSVGVLNPRWSTSKVRFTEGDSAQVQVVVDATRPTDQVYTVTRGNGNAPQVTVPAQVVIPAGQTQGTLQLTSVDDSAIKGQLGIYCFLDATSERLTVICDDALRSEAPRIGLVHLGGPCRPGVPQRLCVEVQNPDIADWAGGDITASLVATGCTISATEVTLGAGTRYASFTMTTTTGTPQVVLSHASVSADHDRFIGWPCALEGRTSELRWAGIPTRVAQVVEFTVPYLEPDGTIPDLDLEGVKCQVEPIAWDEATRHPKLFKVFAPATMPGNQSRPGQPGAAIVGCGNGASYAAASIQEADLSTLELRWKIVDNGDVFVARPFVPGDPSIKKTVVRFNGPYVRETIVTVVGRLGAEEMGVFKVVRTSRSDMVCDRLSIIAMNARMDPTETDGDFSSEGDGLIAFDWIRLTGCGGASGAQRVVNAWNRPGNATTEDQHFVEAANDQTSVLTNALVNPAHAQPMMSGRGFVRRVAIYNPASCSETAALWIAQGKHYGGYIARGFGFEEGGYFGNTYAPPWGDMPTWNPSGTSERWDALNYVANNYLTNYLGSSGLGREGLHGNAGANYPTAKWAGWLKGAAPSDFRDAGQALIYLGGQVGLGPNWGAFLQLITDLRLEMCPHLAINVNSWEPLNIKTYTDPVGGTLPTEYALSYQYDLTRIPQLCDQPIDPAKPDRGFYRANRSKRFKNLGGRTFPFPLVWDQSDRNPWDSYSTSAATHVSREISAFGNLYWTSGDYVAHFAIETIALPLACGMGFLAYDPGMPANYRRGEFHRTVPSNLRAAKTIGIDPAVTRTGINRLEGQLSADDGTCRTYAHAGAAVMLHLAVTDPAADTWTSILDAAPTAPFRFDELVQHLWGSVVSESGNVFVQGPDIDPHKRNGNGEGFTNLATRTGSVPGYFTRFPSAPAAEQVPGYYRGNYGIHEGYAAWFVTAVMRRLKHKGTVDWSMLPLFMRAEIVEAAIQAGNPGAFTIFPDTTYAQQSVTGLPEDTPKEGPSTARSIAGWWYGSPNVVPPNQLYPTHGLGHVLCINMLERGRIPGISKLVERQTGQIRGLDARAARDAWWEYFRRAMYNATYNPYEAQAFPGIGALDLMRRKYPN